MVVVVGGGVKIKILVFLKKHLKEHYSFKMFLIMENHNFTIDDLTIFLHLKKSQKKVTNIPSIYRY